MVTPLSPRGMDNRQLDQLIRSLGQDVEGELGHWRFNVREIAMFCITDEAHDRMRVMAPILPVADLQPGLLETCMEANFDRALDARYCTSNGTLWGAFIHPLACLTEAQIESAIRQVAEVTRTFGDSFSSGELFFIDRTEE